MRSHCSLYVDAGYLLASAATRVTGTSLRNGIHVEYRTLIESLIEQAVGSSELPALRVHWYDSAKNGVPNTQQERIGELPSVKLRLGRFGVDGQQKGVDLRMGLDLVTHARNGAADVFFLVSGDDDLAEAVEEAQVHGVQVVIFAVPNGDGKPHGVSRHLIRAADALEVLLPSAIDESVIKVEVPPQAPAVPSPAPVPVEATIPSPMSLAGRTRPIAPAPARTIIAYTSSTGTEPRPAHGCAAVDEHSGEIDEVVGKVLGSFRQSATPDAVANLLRGRPSIPREIDRALLQDLSDALTVYDLSDPIRFRLRDRFWELYDESSS